jgi:hypothetical protein
MTLVDPFEDFQVPPELVLEFVAVFSRCEYAMKEGDYRRDSRGITSAAWQALAEGAGTWLAVPVDGDLAAAVKLLTENPPMVHKYTDGWQSVEFSGRNRSPLPEPAKTDLFSRPDGSTWTLPIADCEPAMASSIIGFKAKFLASRFLSSSSMNPSGRFIWKIGCNSVLLY